MTSLSTRINPVPFENATINDGDVFNLLTHRFVAPFTGFYWIHFSIGIPTDTWADVRLLGAYRPFDIVRYHTNFTGTPITTSRDEIILLREAKELWLSSKYAIYSDQFVQTSFSGFPLTLLFDPFVAFSVARSTSLAAQSDVRISYDIVNINTDIAWNTVKNEYIAPYSGTYIINLSTGAHPKRHLVVQIWVNNVHLASNVIFTSCHHGIDVISRTIITTLRAGDHLYTQFDPYYGSILSVYSSAHHQLTTLQGFLYSPYRSVPIAWCVGRKKNRILTGELYPVEFDDILINQGNGWNENTNRYLVPLAGVYYIHLTTGTSYSRSKLELMRNGLPVMNVQVESNNTGLFLTGRAIILRLKKYEELCLRLPFGYYIAVSNGHKYVSFTGFRIYE